MSFNNNIFYYIYFDFGTEVVIVSEIPFLNVSTRSEVARSVICFSLPFCSPHTSLSIRAFGQTTLTDE